MTTHTTSPKTKRIILFVFLALLLLVFLWLGLKTWRLYQTGQALLNRTAEVETLMADGLTQIDPDTAESLVMDTRRDFQTLKKETAVFMPITPYLGWVPKVGSTLVIAPTLMQMGESGLDAAAYGVRGLKPALAILQNENSAETSQSTISQLSGVLVEAAPDLAATNEKLAEVAAARATITNTDELPWRLQTLFALSDEWLPFAQEGLTLTAVLPELLGENGPRTYLVLAQNEDEIRPTGGYISSAGTLTVENGEIISLDMGDPFFVDNWRDKPYDAPPEPFHDYMGMDLLFFRDANYWPDFPTSAEKMMDLYSYGQDIPPLAGVIAIDQEFLRLIVEATGPINISETSLTINAKNAIETLQEAWGDREDQTTSEWVMDRKAFIGIFAFEIINHFQNKFGEIDPITFATNMRTAVAGKHLQIYLRDPQSTTTLDQINWDGRLENPQGQDFLAVVDTNMGFNKANLLIQRNSEYQIELNGDGNGTAQLTVSYTHTGQKSVEDCIQATNYIYAEGGSYLDLAEQCYWTYQRVYVPENSQLITASIHDTPAESMNIGQAIHSVSNTYTEQADFTTFDSFLMVPYGESVSTTYEYQLPTIVKSDKNGSQQYQLTIRPQAGIASESVSITITLPDEMSLITSNLEPSAVDGQTLMFDLILDADKTITVTYH